MDALSSPALIFFIFVLVRKAALASVGMDAVAAQLPPLDGVLGCLFLGTCLGLILLGLTVYMAYHYARTYPSDSRWLKGLVALVVLLEAASSALTMHICYWYMVTNFFQPERIDMGIWSAQLYPFAKGATMVVSQSFFVRRVWLLEPRFRGVVIISCLCSLAVLGSFLAGSTLSFLANQLLENTLYESRVIPVAFYLAFLADALLTASLIYILHRKRTGFKSTNTMIDVLILYSVNTGLLNGVFDLLTATFALVYPNELVYTVVGIPATKLYGITLLAALNYRRTVLARGFATSHDDASDRPDAVFGVSFVRPTAPDTVTDTRLSFRSARRSHAFESQTTDMSEASDVLEPRTPPEGGSPDEHHRDTDCIPGPASRHSAPIQCV